MSERISGLASLLFQATTSRLGGMSASGTVVSPSGVVVPGHNDINGPQLLSDVWDYLQLLRDETWRRQDSAMSEDTIAAEVTDVMIKRHPDWDGQEWIRPGVGCLCAEHTSNH